MSTGKQASQRKFGCILELKRQDGSVFALQARYSAPPDSHRVYKNFKPEQRAEAIWWLDQEQEYVARCKRGECVYESPAKRKEQGEITFAGFADMFVSQHHNKDGSDLRGGSKRNLRNNVRHLKEAFGDVRLRELNEQTIHSWYYGEHPNGEWQFRSECISLKMILRAACDTGMKGMPPLLASNPFTLPVPPEPEAHSLDVPPVTPEELHCIYDAMPGYTRLSVYLAACVGGLRIGEVCGLQVDDFDLENLTLTIRRGVTRGENDLGPSQLGRLKTTGSRRTVPIPALLLPMIKDHIEDREDRTSPMFFQAKRGEILATNTLRNQFDRARKKANRPDLLFHTLRVTHSTQLMLHGGTLKEAMNSLGHVQEETTLKHYQRIVPEHHRDVTDRTAAYLLASDPTVASTLLLTGHKPEDPATSSWATIALLMGQVANLMAAVIPEQEMKTNARQVTAA
ncbi:tyrosine-type recombinase/integrase [Bifidobacterium miconisargentati]|uniref:tyrosine-type recombinase/integrase n=1 Tax=Bifidobacterium miconisargentati TaxID=2834437 RepID=UPI001BDD900C|nr:site-specific integrase [Bifidobacterium miconisargentati]MBW3089194.1 site-specific integrase [Bifidobacterium miconisargentati]